MTDLCEQCGREITEGGHIHDVHIEELPSDLDQDGVPQDLVELKFCHKRCLSDWVQAHGGYHSGPISIDDIKWTEVGHEPV